MQRRAFVGTTAAALAGALHGPRGRRRKLGRIGLQLYTVRHELQRDFDGTIARVAATGYREVEFAGYFGKAPRELRALLDQHGLSAYHNHDFEFTPLEGRLPYDVLLAETDPQLVQLEIDLYWITKGGQDPLAYFARWPGRVPMVHVKDSAGPPDHRMTDVGGGTIDWKRIFAQRDQAGIRHLFVEHDEPRDAFASIRASYEYLRKLEF